MKELGIELDKVKEQVKEQGAVGAAVNQLKDRSQKIQAKINEFLAKRGVLTDKDIADAEAFLRSLRRSEMEQSYTLGVKNMYLIVGGIILGFVGLYFVLQKGKK